MASMSKSGSVLTPFITRHDKEPDDLINKKVLSISTFAILVRWCVSLGGYSGAGKPPMFGDYEAQRHWMEITVNLPVQQWYSNSSQNDLMYWGLDYPPLTAYHSYVCGLVARLVNSEWVALNTSRGYESYEHKLFMRYSVLVMDLLLFFPAVYWMFAARKPNPDDSDTTMKGYLLMLLYPGLILIDYGHFQYNCVSLGFALAAVVCLASGREVAGSALFCLALNYKQMELYHALPFFCFLLGSCLKNIRQDGLMRLIKIGITVILTFVLCWAPFLHSVDSAQQVLHRLFPFARGVFEDKVANVWCSISVFVKLKQLLSRDEVLLLCLGTTLVMLLPSSLDLLVRPSFKKFRYALVNSSLIFFLFSFQVHEKSILIPALIVCTLILDRPLWCLWFLLVSTFSMLPLLIKDGLLSAYLSLMVMYPVLYYCFYPVNKTETVQKSPDSLVWSDIITKLLFCISMVGVAVITLATIIVPPPDHLPDLFPLIVSVYSCAHFLLFTIYFHYCQFTSKKYRLKSEKSDKSHLAKGDHVKQPKNLSKSAKLKKKQQ